MGWPLTAAVAPRDVFPVGVDRSADPELAAMTLDVYAGLFEDGLDDLADRLDATARESADRLRTQAERLAESPTPLRGKTAGQRRWGGSDSNGRPTGYERVQPVDPDLQERGQDGR